MQAINLMIGESGNLVFVLGMDREKVAAGISLKYKNLIAFLPEYQSSIVAAPSAPATAGPLELRRLGHIAPIEVVDEDEDTTLASVCTDDACEVLVECLHEVRVLGVAGTRNVLLELLLHRALNLVQSAKGAEHGEREGSPKTFAPHPGRG
jgi:hypothetical protein